MATLIDGRRMAAEAGAAPGGEDDDIGAARNLAGRRDRVVAGRVHEDQSVPGDLLGIAEDAVERRLAALGDGAERLFEDRGQPAALVAGRGIVVDRSAMLGDMILPPLYVAVELGGDLRRRRAIGEQMLGAVDFRGFRQNADAADAGQNIDGRAQRRIGGDAGHAVRAAALQADDDLADRDRLALQVADLLAISASTPIAFSTDLREPPASWMLKWRLPAATPFWP